jgi:predicted TIM-barrel fold metal-dependent hydrolase
LLKDNRVFVTCQNDDDIAYILQSFSEDNLLIGTDYGHSDNASEIEALRKFQREGKVSQRVVEKMLDDNPRAFYGL